MRIKLDNYAATYILEEDVFMMYLYFTLLPFVAIREVIVDTRLKGRLSFQVSATRQKINVDKFSPKLVTVQIRHTLDHTFSCY
jgi:hypothetical protein